MISKGSPNVITSGRQYNFGEKPSVILYTYINLHAGTPKPKYVAFRRKALFVEGVSEFVKVAGI